MYFVFCTRQVAYDDQGKQSDIAKKMLKRAIIFVSEILATDIGHLSYRMEHKLSNGSQISILDVQVNDPKHKHGVVYMDEDMEIIDTNLDRTELMQNLVEMMCMAKALLPYQLIDFSKIGLPVKACENMFITQVANNLFSYGNLVLEMFSFSSETETYLQTFIYVQDLKEDFLEQAKRYTNARLAASRNQRQTH